MKYFKNTELAKLYHVSEKSVRNWIEATESGKLDLQLFEKNNKNYIANTSKNTILIENLVEKGKKFKNTRGSKTVHPHSKFYEQYSQDQIFDIISSIDIYRELPYEYSFFGKGAHLWDEYAQSLLKNPAPNPLTNTIQLLDLTRDYLDKALAGYGKINIVDVGAGNSLPVKRLLKDLLDEGKLHRYIALDISGEMIEIAKKNIREWFDDKVPFEGHVKDIRHQRFDDLVAADSFGSKDNAIVNVVLFLGGTIANFRQPERVLANIHESMGKHDLLIMSRRLDSPSARRYFDFVTGNDRASHIFRGKMLLELLGIDASMYSMEQFFDEGDRARKVEVALNVALTINFEFKGQTRSISLNKDDRILLWRATHQTLYEVIQQFKEAYFNPLLTAKSKDRQYVELISAIAPTIHDQ